MRWDGFGRSLLFGALAAAGWPLLALLAGPLLGAAGALRVWLVLVAALYTAGLSPRRARAVAAASAVAAATGALALLAPGLGELALGAALVLGVARSGLLFRARTARALALEAALLGGGLLLARGVGDGSLLGVALSLWSFFLVQSLFFLVGGAAARSDEAAGLDGFELARHRLEALLDDE